jgi:DNA-binding beta-propeller fold protein YncE
MNGTSTRFFVLRLAKAPAVCFSLAAILVGCALSQRDAAGGLEPELGRVIVLAGVRGTRPNLGIPGRIDHMAYDPATKRLFVSALENGSLEVLDLERGTRVQSIGGLSRPQGVVIVPVSSCAVTACGGNGVAHVYDTRSLVERTNIYVGPDADNVRYDPEANTVYICYGNSNNGAIAVLDPHHWGKIRDLPFVSKPESFQLEPGENLLFANIPGGKISSKDGVVISVNRNDGKIEAQTELKDRARNFPMALDPVHERVFIVCRKPARLIALDARTCSILAEAPCTDDSDDMYYDAETGRVLVIGGGFRPDMKDAGTASPCSPPGEMGAIDVFSVGQNGELARVASTPTAIHARTGLFVPSRRAVYVAVPMRAGRDPEIREYKIPR